MPAASRRAFRPSKCRRDSSSRKSAIFGASASSAWVSGDLLSSPCGAGAQAVQLQGDRVANTEQAPQAPGQHDQLGVDIRTIDIEDFHADLVELAVTPLLWTLMAEHRPDVPEFLRLSATGQTMFEHGPHAGGGAFGAQGQGGAVAILEGVHLRSEENTSELQSQ